jgi:hypothetical protein
MCKTTRRTKTANPAGGTPAQIRKPPPLPPIQSLQHFLTAAYTAERANLEPSSMVLNGFTLKSKDAAMSIVMLDGGTHQYAEINGKAMDYSGSLVKVAALYAAHDLRAAARQHAKDSTFTSAAGFTSSFLSAINTTGAVPSLIAFGKGLKPNLNDVFTGFRSTAPNKVEFKPGFQTALNDIGHNASAGQVIRALGYSFINVSLMRGGFFDRTNSKGIWLAGDYSAEKITKSVRVPVDNDVVAGGSGQAITTEQMSRMFWLVHLGQAYSHVADATERAAANSGVHTILQNEGAFFFDTEPDRVMHLSVTPAFTNECAKVGIGSLGPLKPDGTTDGPSVYSEGAVMVWNSATEVTAFNTAKQRTLTGHFALVWQNMYDANPRWDALVRIVNTSIKTFLTQP